MSESIMITGEERIRIAQLCTLRSGLKLELAGLQMRMGRQSAYSIIKSRFGFKGNKRRVYEQFCDYINGEKERIFD